MDIRLHLDSDALVQQGLASAGDIDLSSGVLQLVDGPSAIAQHLRIRLRTFLGEWFLDTRVGIPYFQNILGQALDTGILANIFSQVILKTPGVESIGDLVVSYDSIARALSIVFTATIQGSNTPLEFVEDILIL